MDNLILLWDLDKNLYLITIEILVNLLLFNILKTGFDE